jgi:hypothetical protein
MNCLASSNKEKGHWKHGFGTKPSSPAKFEFYGGFESIGTGFTITIMTDNSLLALHQNGSRVVIAPQTTWEAAQSVAFSISDFWTAGKNIKKRG